MIITQWILIIGLISISFASGILIMWKYIGISSPKALVGLVQTMIVTPMFAIVLYLSTIEGNTYKRAYEQELKREKDSAKYEMVIDTLYKKKR